MTSRQGIAELEDVACKDFLTSDPWVMCCLYSCRPIDNATISPTNLTQREDELGLFVGQNVALDRGFLTWGANALGLRGCWNEFQGCWWRSHMWWWKVCLWAFLYFLIVFVKANCHNCCYCFGEWTKHIMWSRSVLHLSFLYFILIVTTTRC